MKSLRYFVEFIIIKLLFLIFNFIGFVNSSKLGGFIGVNLGPLFRNKKIIEQNLQLSRIGKNYSERKKIVKNMWGNYGRIFAEYPHIKNFRNDKLSKYLVINGQDVLNKIIEKKKKVIFVSGHFNNFELMAMHIEKSGINLAAIYRPLNNFFLNKTMEDIRRSYICKKQIKKGKSGVREIINLLNDNYSIALMIDQRVSEGIKSKFFLRDAFTTTIPAQLVKKYKLDVVPVYIERKSKKFKIYYDEPIKFNQEDSIEKITEHLNKILEKMIIKNPDQWIWSHNRWKL